MPGILAFRPPTVVGRLAPRSGACPLSTAELLQAGAGSGLVLPLVNAPVPEVARAALLAARELDSALGLGLPGGVPAAPWFEAVVSAADEVAGALPLFLRGEVTLAGEGVTELERAVRETWRLVDAGLTHLALDASAVAPGERGRILAELAPAAVERGLCVELVVATGDGADAATRAADVQEALARRGAAAHLASVRCAAPADDGEARLQAAALARLSHALGGLPVMRRGPVTPALLAVLRGSPVKVCDDGGTVAARALGPGAGPARDQAGAADAERLEARAFFEALELLELLGAEGSAASVARALAARLEDR